MVLDKWRKLTHLLVMKQFENLCGWKKKETHHYHQTKNIQIQNAKKTF